jgi:hypothetical protein
MLLLTETVTLPGSDLATLQQGIGDGSLHLHRSPAGEWWVCLQSLQQS